MFGNPSRGEYRRFDFSEFQVYYRFPDCQFVNRPWRKKNRGDLKITNHRHKWAKDCDCVINPQ